MLYVAGDGPSTSRFVFLMNASKSLICEMGSNFEFLQLIWAVLSRQEEVCCTLGKGVAGINKVSFLNCSLLTVALNSFFGSESEP